MSKLQLLILTVAMLSMTGCAILVKDCEQQGNSQYYHCHRVWMAKQ